MPLGEKKPLSQNSPLPSSPPPDPSNPTSLLSASAILFLRGISLHDYEH